MSRPLLGASVAGASAWIIHQILHEPLKTRIRQLEVDPHVPGDIVRHLVATRLGFRRRLGSTANWLRKLRKCRGAGLVQP